MGRPTHRAVIEAEDEGKTLAALVRAIVPDTSWNRARELCRSGRVRLDGELAFDAAARVRAESVIEIDPVGPRRKSTPLDESRIAYVDAEIVVVRKPAGIVSVPFEAGERDTLIDRTQAALRQKGPLGIVQRLDKDTTGLIVFARTRAARKGLERQFRDHTIARRYLALVVGAATEATHETQLVPNRGDGKRGSWRGRGKPPRNAKRAVTRVEIVDSLPGATLVACRLETGRQHQIRIHLAEAGTPLVGERVYTPRDGTALVGPRPLLHAATLGFRHPTTDVFMQLEDPLPADFEAMLQQLRTGAPE